MPRSRITGTGFAVPDRVVRNDDLAQLMDQIRKDAESRKRSSLNNGDPARYRQLIIQNFNAFLAPQISSLPPLMLQPELEKRDRYHLNDLLGFHDEVFVRNAYKVILKREPDDSGMAHFLKGVFRPCSSQTKSHLNYLLFTRCERCQHFVGDLSQI